MTCFWDGIFKSLNNDDFKLIGEKKPTFAILLIYLKLKY